MKVYVVTDGEYSDYGIVGVFSTREKAETYLAEIRKHNPWFGNDPEEYATDELAGQVSRPFWHAQVMFNGPQAGVVTDYAAPVGREMAAPDEVLRVNHQPWGAGVTSYESPDHARNVAAEEYQRWLREKATHPAEAGK